MFKLGNSILLSTTTNSVNTTVEFDVSEYLKDAESWDLPARTSSAIEKPGTTVRILDPDAETAAVIGNISERKAIEKEISEIYSEFLKKGLKIWFNGVEVEPSFVELRDDGPFKVMQETMVFDGNVRIEIVAGQHSKHRFAAEPDASKGQNKKLTSDYGWTVICNDRPVILRNREQVTGWTAKFHTQFYGFVGYVKFYSNDAKLLPWNTSKTGVDAPNAAYQTALVEMQAIAGKWRRFSAIARDFKERKEKLLPFAQQTEPVLVENADKESKVEPTPMVHPNPRPRKDWAVLPADVDDSRCSDKVKSVVYEAKLISIKDYKYASLALLRTLFEVAALDYLIFSKRINDLKDKLTEDRNLARQAQGKLKLTKNSGRKYQPSLSEICDYLNKNPHLWGGEKETFLKGSLQLFIARKAQLNAGLHDPVRRVGADTVEGIRDEVLPIIRHLIEHRESEDK